MYSELGQGTTFKIYLPRIDQPLEEAVTPAAAPRSQDGSETILIVEDDAEVRRLLCQVLRARGYRVLESTKGDEAIAAVESHPGPVELIVADVVLPGMSGPEVVRHVAQRKPGIRALYISGYTDEAVQRHGILDSGVTFLSKPFLPDALATKVRELLDAS